MKVAVFSRKATLPAPAILLLLLAGCGGKPAVQTGTVSGQVTHHGGKPLTNAEISFVAPQLASGGSAQLGPDGRYSIEAPLKVGNYQVMVAPPTAPSQPGDAPTVHVEIDNPDIPAKARSYATSGLTATIEAGQNQLNFELND